MTTEDGTTPLPKAPAHAVPDLSAAARRLNAQAYLAWDAETGRPSLDELDQESTKISLAGAEW